MACAVAACKNSNMSTKGKNIKYYRFPQNEELAKQWIMACRREDKFNLKNARVCSIHFEEDSFEVPLIQKWLNYCPKNSRNLKANAVPVLCLSSSYRKRKPRKARRPKIICKKRQPTVQKTLNDSSHFVDPQPSSLNAETAEISENKTHKTNKLKEVNKNLEKQNKVLIQNVQKKDPTHKKLENQVAIVFTPEPISNLINPANLVSALNMKSTILNITKAAQNTMEVPSTEIEIKYEPNTKNLEDLIKEIKEEPLDNVEAVEPLYYSPPNEPECSEWNERNATETSLANSDTGYSNKSCENVESKLPDPCSVKEEICDDNDRLADPDTPSSTTVKSEAVYFELKTEEDIKQEEIKQDELIFEDNLTGLHANPICSNASQCTSGHFETDTRVQLGSDLVLSNQKIGCKVNLQSNVKCSQSNTNVHKNVNWFQCKYCDYKCQYKNNLKRHETGHINPKEIEWYSCEQCSYKTKFKATLKQHSLIHKDVNSVQSFQCTFCDYKAVQKPNLSRHLLKHKHSSEIKWYQCASCDYKAKTKGHIKGHILTHKDISDIRSFQCETCSYKTKYKRALKQHSIIHTSVKEIKWFSCEHCDYKTKYKGSLKEHSIIHKDLNNIKWFQCTHCDYKAKKKGSLVVHMLQHTDANEIRWHQCTHCEYKAKYKGDLITHLVTHKDNSEVIWFQCEECSYKSKYKKHLKQHINIIHKNSQEVQWFSCENCNFKTKYRSCLKRHTIRKCNKNIEVKTTDVYEGSV